MKIQPVMAAPRHQEDMAYSVRPRWKKFIAPAGMLVLLLLAGSATSCTRSDPGKDLENEASPFGISSPYTVDSSVTTTADITSGLVDIGTRWIRICDGELNAYGADALGQNINVHVIVSPTGLNTSLLSKYQAQVKYWEVANEPDAPVAEGGMTAADYVVLLKSVSDGVRVSCPNCKIVLGGFKDGTGVTSTSQGPAFLAEILSLGAGQYFDIFNYHTQGVANDYRLIENDVSVYQSVLRSYGADKQVWITEIATYDGTPSATFPAQTEREQAGGLVKRYVFGLHNGVKKLFWSGLLELSGFPDPYYENVGLVHNPLNQPGPTSPTRKLSFYTYKKMVEMLGIADLDDIQAVQESDPVFVYSSASGGSTIYIAWCDTCSSASQKSVILTGVSGSAASMTDALPNVRTGADVADYTTAFITSSTLVSGGTLTVSLGDSPVYITVQ